MSGDASIHLLTRGEGGPVVPHGVAAAAAGKTVA
jgi:hypothetical protein